MPKRAEFRIYLSKSSEGFLVVKRVTFPYGRQMQGKFLISAVKYIKFMMVNKINAKLKLINREYIITYEDNYG